MKAIITDEDRKIQKRIWQAKALEGIQKLKLPRKMKLWIADKEGFDVDYSPYDFEGRPNKLEN